MLDYNRRAQLATLALTFLAAVAIIICRGIVLAAWDGRLWTH